MNAVTEVVALLFGFVAVLLVGVSLEDPFWRVSSDDGNVIRTSTIYENLWRSCASDSSGVFNCRDFPSLFALPGRGWVGLGVGGIKSLSPIIL
ncbi:claudin-15-like isoform X1 [Arapaima gigas]